MIDIDKIERAAEAACSLHDAPSGQWWYDIEDFFYGIDFTEDADLAAACSPQTILKLIAVARAAKAMMDLYDKLALVLPGSEPDALSEALEGLK